MLRSGPHGTADTQVLVVHRPTYGDWSLPKGKLHAGEGWLAAARREVLEETGVSSEPVEELPPTSYTDAAGRPKTVRWWWMRPVEGRPGDRRADEEVDVARWLSVEEARRRLTYDSDRSLLDEAVRRADGSS